MYQINIMILGIISDKLSKFDLLFLYYKIQKNQLKFLLTKNNMCRVHKLKKNDGKKWGLKGNI